MSPVQSYFRWHDAKYLAHAENPRKLEGAIRILRTMRIVLLLLVALLWALMVAGLGMMLLADDFRGILPEAAILGVGVMSAVVALFYLWVTEALLFRQYIQNHRV